MKYKSKYIVYLTGTITGLAFDPDPEPCPVKLNNYIKIKTENTALYYSPNGFNTDIRYATPFSLQKACKIVNQLKSFCRKYKIEIFVFTTALQSISARDFYMNETETLEEYVLRLVLLLNSVHWLTSSVMKNLSDPEYCQKELGLKFPFFSKNPTLIGAPFHYNKTKLTINQTAYYLLKTWDKVIYRDKLYEFVSDLLQSHGDPFPAP